MRFNDYCKERVDEKVSKPEMDEALKNPRVFIGAEFEFMVDELKDWQGGGSEYQSDYEAADRDYDDFNREWRAFESERDDLWDKIRELEERKDELEDEEIPNKEQEIEEAEEEEADTTTLEKEIYKLRKELDRVISDITDAENERDEQEYPYPGYRYIDYMKTLYHEFGIGENSEGIPDYFVEDGEIPQPPAPDELGINGDLGDEEVWKEAMEEISSSLFRDFPLSRDPEIGGYHDHQQKKGDKFWTITHDGSISDEGGAELVSPPMTLPEFVNLCPKIFAWINRVGETTSATGFHVHMSIEGVGRLKDAIDPIKLMVMTDEGGIYEFFEGREFNSYVQSTKRMLANRGIGPDDIGRLINHNKLERKISAGHSDAISFANIDEGHIEFRHMGGNDYAKKWNEVKTIVGRHSHNLSVACDDNYKRQEYLTRLARIANKIDNMKYQKLIYWIVEAQGLLKTMIKKYEVTLEERKQLYAVDQLLTKHKDTLRKQIETTGGLPEKTMRQMFDNSSDFVRSSEKYAQTALTELINKTKMASMERIIDELTPYIDKRYIKK